MPESCPRCATGILVRRVGPHGPFLGCDQFPRCRGNRALDEVDEYMERIGSTDRSTSKRVLARYADDEPLPTPPPEEDDGYPGPCTEPDYEGIMERRAERRGSAWIEP